MLKCFVGFISLYENVFEGFKGHFRRPFGFKLLGGA